MYEALVGVRVMQAHKSLEELIGIAEGQTPYPWERAPNAYFDESNVRDVVRECLRRNAALRPTAAALREAVDRMGRRTSGAATRMPTAARTMTAQSKLSTEAPSVATDAYDMSTLNR